MTASTHRGPVDTGAIVAALRDAGILRHTVGRVPATISDVADDSRAVAPGTLFIAVRGTARDGHAFLADAAAAGASVAIVEDAGQGTLPAIVVSDARRAATIAASVVQGAPGDLLSIVGVTGTSGKSTSVAMLRHLLDDAGAPAASIGTLGVLVGSAGAALPGGSGLTTPGPVDMQRLLRRLVDGGVRTVAMEVSSHALHQHRVDGVPFDAALFTNLTRDHLDYHGSMEAYLAAKTRLASLLRVDGTLVINADVDSWRTVASGHRRVRFGMRAAEAEVRAERVSFHSGGSRWTLATPSGRAPVALPLIGDFNVANALGAAATAWALGLPTDTIAQRLATIPQVPGRLERILEVPTVLRDYAHKPDALERALDAVRPFTAGRLILVVGCGGDRDRGKRPIMGGIAERLADLVILTSDNPRTEDPERILDDIEGGMRGTHARIEDRHAAIARALEIAQPDDVVLLAGKGHETYQIRGTTSHPFDERAIVQALAAGTVGSDA